MDKPLVSVCINAYNTERFIFDAVNSVLKQTYDNLQIIIVDDGSTDETVKIIKEKFSDDRIEIYSRSVNYHISYTCNEAISHAKGKYIFHLDSDDMVVPDAIEKEVCFLESHPETAAVFCLPEVIDIDGNVCDHSCDYIRDWFRFVPETREDMLRFFYYKFNFLLHTGSAVRKTVLDEIGGHNGSLCYLHDFDLWARILVKYPIYVFKEKLALYRKTDANNSAFSIKRLKIHNFEQARIAYRMIELCPDDLFLCTFSDKLRLKGEHTHEETEIEKAFLLSDGIYAYKQNKILSALKFSELFAKPGYAEIAYEKFGFSFRDFLDLETESLLYDQRETDNLLSEISAKSAEIESLRIALDNCSASLYKEKKLSHFTVKFYVFRIFKAFKSLCRHIKHYFSLLKKDGVKYKKAVFVYGNQNICFGDDLILSSLFSRCPNVMFVVYSSPEHYDFFAKFKNVKFYNSELPHIRKINKFGKLFGKSELFCNLLMKKCSGTVRTDGKPSAKNSICLSQDMLFSCVTPACDTVNGKVAISVTNPEMQNEKFSFEDYLFSLKETVVSLVLSGKTVDLIGLCPSEKDNEFSDKLYSVLPEYIKDGVKTVNYGFADKDEVLASLSSAEYIVGARPSAIILGIAMGKKILPAFCDGKTADILSIIKFGGAKIDFNDFKKHCENGFAEMVLKAEPFDAKELSISAEQKLSQLNELCR